MVDQEYGGSQKLAGYRSNQALPLRYKSVGIRFLAILIDMIIIGIVARIVTLPLGASLGVTVNQQTGAISIASVYWIIVTIQLLITFLYFTILEGRYGQTVGKIVLKIKVLKADGSPINYKDACIRTILRVIDGVPFIVPYLLGAILIWSSDTKQRIGDRVAHTVVVQA